MLKYLFNRQINSITMAAFLVAFSSLISRLLGVFRDRILAGEFGAGETLDIYYAAFRIPDLIFNLVVLGALSAGFIPIFIKLIKSPVKKIEGMITGDYYKEAWLLASNVINILGIGLIILAALGIIFSPYLMNLITPGFTGEKMAITVNLTKIMFLSPLILGISSVFGGILQSFKRFFVYSLSPIFYNIGIIVGALYFVPLWGIHGLAWGVVLGAGFHLLIQIPTVFYLGFNYSLKFRFRDKNLKKIWSMMMPRTMTLAIAQINLLVITIIASTLSSGSLTIFNFANNLQSFPIGIFGISFAVAAFPILSEVAFDKKKIIDSLSKVIRQVLFFIIPSTVLLLTLRAQIIRVILGTGQFDWQDTVLTINTLGFFSLSLFAQSLVHLLVRVFYARHNSRTPFFVGLAVAVINIFLSFGFSKEMGVEGLALAFSLTNIINFIILWLILHNNFGNLDEVRILISTIKFSAAAIGSGIAIQGMKFIIWPFIDMSKTIGVLTQGFVAGLIGVIIYFLICYILQSEELIDFWTLLKHRLPWFKVETSDQGEARGI